MSPQPLPVAVLISGTGSNLKALINAVEQDHLELDLCHVISNRTDAPGLDHASDAGIPCSVINAHSAGGSEDQDREIGQCLAACGAELVVLAGYMRILGADLVQRFLGQMINLHPSLLPRYPGLHTYERVIANGDHEHGASIHYVTTELDGGPVISQVRIPVLPHDTSDTLAARLGPREHNLLQATVELFTHGRVKMRPGGVLLDAQRLQQPLVLSVNNDFE